MARELSMNGNTKLKTILQEFTDRFPFIRLSIYASTEREKSSKVPLDFEKTIAEVREVKSSEPAIIRGGQKVRNLEKMINDVFGLYCQVAYTDKNGNNTYTTGNLDEMSLRELNAHGEENGWQKDKWHISIK
ncbi:MAG: hypothetical protein NT127_05870 [Sphingobacteriales bacterium]|jgi:hypothetical protein|nr:hypothetical protein [Sphingobacteriales bacterium]